MAGSLYSTFAVLGFPVLLGGMITCPLFGITVAQTIWYFRHYPEDSIYLKSWIAALLAIDTVQSISILEASKLVYLRAQITLQYPSGLVLDLYTACLTVTMVQSTFTYRVWILSEKRWLVTSVLALLTACQFSAGIGMAILQQTHGNISDLHSPISNALGAFELGSAVLCDLLISALLAYYLNQKRSGVRKTENIVDKLILYVVGIGLLTTVFAIVVFVTWLAMPDKLIFMTFHSIISKFYVNSLLVTLNARSSLRDGPGSYAESSIHLSVLGSGDSH